MSLFDKIFYILMYYSSSLAIKSNILPHVNLHVRGLMFHAYILLLFALPENQISRTIPIHEALRKFYRSYIRGFWHDGGYLTMPN